MPKAGERAPSTEVGARSTSWQAYSERAQHPHPLHRQGFSQPHAGAHRHSVLASVEQAQSPWLQSLQAHSVLLVLFIISSPWMSFRLAHPC
jgi:hypothetical protein